VETTSFHMLCALGSVAFIASAWSADLKRPAIAGGFGLALVLALLAADLLPDPVWTGALTAFAAAFLLLQPGERSAWISGAFAGCLAGTWAGLIEAAGVPLWGALPVALTPALVCARLRWLRADFASTQVRQEALALIALLALVTASAPSVSAGWESAGVLNTGGSGLAFPGVWVAGTVLGSFASGAAFAAWKRK